MKTIKIALMALAMAAVTTQVAVVTAAQQEQQKPPAKAVSIAGKWAMTLDIPNMGSAETALDLKQDGEKITGTYTGRYGTYQLEGALKGRDLEFGFNMNAEGQPVSMQFKGQVAEDAQSMKGTCLLGELGEATWVAKVKKD